MSHPDEMPQPVATWEPKGPWTRHHWSPGAEPAVLIGSSIMLPYNQLAVLFASPLRPPIRLEHEWQSTRLEALYRR